MNKKIMEYEKLSIYELNNKLKAYNQLLDENKENEKIVSELLKDKIFIEKLIKEKEEEVRKIKKWYYVELNKQDTHDFTMYLKINKTKYEVSQINNDLYHIELYCNEYELSYIQDYLNKYF